ncbi:MAG TPA: hypothetical protein VGL94_12530 [Ktedonobacteraceae bacterium]|jgi:hypothetical protein
MRVLIFSKAPKAEGPGHLPEPQGMRTPTGMAPPQNSHPRMVGTVRDFTDPLRPQSSRGYATPARRSDDVGESEAARTKVRAECHIHRYPTSHEMSVESQSALQAASPILLEGFQLLGRCSKIENGTSLKADPEPVRTRVHLVAQPVGTLFAKIRPQLLQIYIIATALQW